MDDSEVPLDAAREHEWCLLCGNRNPHSLHLEFLPEGEGVLAELTPGPELQGYNGLVHGGVVAALLDSTMTNCLFKRGVRALTGDLHLRFLHPVRSGREVQVRAWIETARPPLYLMKSELCQDGRVLVKGDAKFMRQRQENLR